MTNEEEYEDLDFSEAAKIMEAQRKAESLKQTPRQNNFQASSEVNAKRGRPRSEVAKEKRTYYVEIELADELSMFVGKVKTLRNKAGKRISISESQVVNEGIRLALREYRKKYKTAD
jgi:hypothetical protein